MNGKDGIYQTTGEHAVEMFAAKLLRPSTYGHCGFNDMNKAMDPSLAEREELNLGYMSDKELAAEIDTLNGFLREERGMYERGTHFFNILDGAQQRIRHLSKRLERALGKEIIDPEANVQILGRLKSPMAHTFNELITHPGGGHFVEKGVEVRVIPDDERNVKWEELAKVEKPAEFICADGAGIEQAPSVEVGASLGADFVGDHEYVSIRQTKDRPEPGDLLTLDGLPEGRTILGNESVMVSRGFGVTWFEFASLTSERASSITRIATLVSRACFRFELQRADKLSTLVNKIIKKHPDISDQLILDCFEVASPDMINATNERLVQMWNRWLDLVAIIDARPLPDKES